MNRVHTVTLRFLAGSLLVWLCFASEMQAQTPPAQDQTKAANADQKKAADDPFAAAQAPCRQLTSRFEEETCRGRSS